MALPPVAPISSASKLWFTGDSLTGNGGTPLQLLAPIHAKQAGNARKTTVSGSAPSSVLRQGNGLAPVIYQPFTYTTQAVFNGYAGQGVQYWIDNLTGGINILGSLAAGYSPTHIFSWLSPNDNGLYNQAQYNAKQTQLVGQFKAAFPTAQIILISQLCNGELWDTVTGWGDNAQDANILLQEAAKQAVCASFNIPYIDLRPSLLTWEQTNNNVNPVGNQRGNAAALTADGLHPSVGVGQAQVAAWIYSNLTVS